jgi:O-antigen/teichoic acid export membrane protein
MLWYQRLRQRLLNDPRFARILHGSLSGLMGRGFTLLVSAVTLPLTLHYLGKLEYGLWVTVSTSVTMLSVLDLGIANTLTNFIAEAHAAEDREKAQRYFATAFWVTVGIVLLLAPTMYAVWRIVNWGALFHLSDPVLVAHAAECVAVAGGFFLLSLPLGLAARVLVGYHEVHFTNYFSMANSVFGLLAIGVTILLHGSIVLLIAAYSVAMLVGPLGMNLWLCLWHRPWVSPLPSKIRLTIIRRLFGQGILFFILQLTGLVVFNSDNLVIAHYLGAAAVTPYSVAWRLAQYAYVLQNLMIPSLWPAFTEAYHKGQLDWINSAYRSLNRNVLIAVGFAALVIGVAGRTVIRIWAGAAAVPGRELLWLMALFAFILSITTNQALLLTATGRLRLEAAVAVIAAVANLVLSIFLVQRLGVEGVILSSIASFLLIMVVPQAWEVKRVLQGRYLPHNPEPKVALS